MCGILGTAGFVASDDAWHRALGALASRGPDMAGDWSNAATRRGGTAPPTPDAHNLPPVRLGHRRLSIVDLTEAGRQPMTTADDRLTCVCNGEIYNYPALREELEARGARFASNSDSEVLLHAYRQWGPALVERLTGMFAFALWDSEAETLLLARDRVGIKPLYWAKVNGGVIFASTADALLELQPSLREIDPTAIALTLAHGYVPAPRTIWRDVHKLEAGQTLTLRAGHRPAVESWWQPPTATERNPIDPADALDHFTGAFGQVLDDHMLSDVPIGLFLSGGLDSTAIAAGLVGRERELTALTVGFNDRPAESEVDQARATADHFGLAHRVIDISAGDVDVLLDRVSATFDEPQGFGALLNSLKLSEATAAHYKVVLGGDGGDELFGGYDWHQRPRVGPTVHWRLLRRLMRGLGLPTERGRGADLAFRAFRHCSPLHRCAARAFGRFLPEQIDWLMPGLAFDDEAMLQPLRRHFAPRLPLRRALQRMDLMTFCADSILPKVDRSSMAFGLEVRVPLLDHRLIDWALALPTDPAEGRQSKPILRRYLAPRAPAGLLDRPKQGFSLRVDWESERRAICDRIERGPLVRNGLWRRDWRKLVDPNLPRASQRLWSLNMLNRWAEHHLG